ncbi:phage/plasmid primase, P4 family [Thalassobaculum sp.]|uniref:DNA primase family protein n=1 Tax=Thalassobaculum sp. TaxID=2022740 RepID=UPI0032EDE769
MDDSETGATPGLPRTRNNEPQNSGVFAAAVGAAFADALGELDGGGEGLVERQSCSTVAPDDGGVDGGGRPFEDADDPGPASEQAGPGSGGKRKPRGSVPIAIARAALDEVNLVTDDAGLVYIYNGASWDQLSATGVRALATVHGAVTMSDAGEVVDYWKRVTHRPGRIWGRVGTHEVAFANGVLDIRDMTLRRHRPEDYLERVLPHPWRPGAHCEFWHAALDEWFGDVRSDQVAALQEFFGYAVTQHARYKKALMITGQSGTGKSRVAEALAMLVGHDRVCSIGVDAMDDPRRCAPIKGAALNVVTELPEGALVKDGAFKALVSTEEKIQIDQKYKEVETYVPTAKHVFATNTLPAITDRSAATFARILLIYMDRKPEQVLSAGEFDELVAAEAEGLLVWAIEGLRRLYAADGAFSEPTSTAELLSEYRREQNPVRQFVEDRCEAEARNAVPTKVFLREFNRWHEGGRPWTTARLTRTLHGLNLDGVEVKPLRYKGKVVRCVLGLRIVEDDEVAEFVVDVQAATGADGLVEASKREAPPPADAEAF